MIHDLVDGGWSEWSWPLSKCFPKSVSRTVKVIRTGRRSCNSPEPQHGGQNCTGEDTGETRDCYSYPGEGERKLTSLTFVETILTERLFPGQEPGLIS